MIGDELDGMVRSEAGRAALTGQPAPSIHIYNHAPTSTTAAPSRRSRRRKKASTSTTASPRPRRRRKTTAKRATGTRRRKTTTKRAAGTRRRKPTTKRRATTKRTTTKRTTTKRPGKKAFKVDYSVNGVPSSTTVRATGPKSAQKALKATLPSATHVTVEKKAPKRKARR